MSRAPKVKIVAARMLAPKATRPISGAARRTFPAWIDASERGVAFSAVAVVPRVRDGLVLRMVGRSKQPAVAKRNAHGSSAR
jgi:hypothetical protein